jgi:REP element-mobilizing transposase RayT
MRTWDDNDYPIAYLLTFRTYGTWLPGDDRGSIDRYHNAFRGPRVAPNEVLRDQHNAKLKSPAVLLDAEMRKVVDAAIREVCTVRGWALLAIHVRTNHAHVVTSIGGVPPANAMRDLKAYSTRALKDAGLWPFDHSPWVDGGSKRFLWSESSVANACDYVVNGQGAPLPDSF